MVLHRSLLIVTAALLLLLVACGDEAQPTTSPGGPVQESSDTPVETNGEVQVVATLPPEPTEVPATPTPAEPLAAVVNGWPIYLSEYERELERYETGLRIIGMNAADQGVNNREIVLDALIEKELIRQAAEGMGLAVTIETVDQRLLELEEASGGPDPFAAWLAKNDWNVEEFRSALTSEMLAEKAVEIITVDVPTAVEQVEARYIQVDDLALAQSILDQIKSGTEFADLAQQYSLDRMTGENGGDLGYFAPGSLLVPEVEAAAFDLQAGEVSEVITGGRADGQGTVYYIVQVMERDPERTLSAELRFNLLQEKFESWLEEQWLSADITRYIEPSG